MKYSLSRRRQLLVLWLFGLKIMKTLEFLVVFFVTALTHSIVGWKTVENSRETSE